MTSDDQFMTMTVELPDPKEADVVEIFLTAEDLRFLIRDLQMMQNGKMDHVHFMSSDWGGDELCTTPRRPGSKIVHHLRIDLVDKE
jgi:hypothetical protein